MAGGEALGVVRARGHAARHGAGRRRRVGVQPGVRARPRRADAAHAARGRCPISGCSRVEGPLFGDGDGGRRPALILAAAANLLAAARRARDARQLRRRLHAAQAAVVVRDGHRRDPRRAAADHRLGGRARSDLSTKAWIALRHRVPLAAAALPGDRVDVSRGLRARRLPDAAGDRAGRTKHGPPVGRSTRRRSCRSAWRRR